MPELTIKHPIPRPDGRAKRCLLGVIIENWYVIMQLDCIYHAYFLLPYGWVSEICLKNIDTIGHWTHNKHPMPHPHRWAMRCLLWENWYVVIRLHRISHGYLCATLWLSIWIMPEKHTSKLYISHWTLKDIELTINTPYLTLTVRYGMFILSIW